MKNKDFGKPLNRLITMVAICMLSLNTMAYDFSYTYQGKTLCYDITSSNTVCVTYYSSDNNYQNNNYVSGDVVIPSSVSNNDETYSVTSIGEYAFRDCSSLTSVTIPNSVTSIGDYAFIDCSSLTSVTIPNSVTSIGYGAFAYCSSLTSVTIPNSVTSIGEAAFYDCSSLTTLNFNAVNCSDFTFYDYPQFYLCPIATINIGDSVQRIPAYFACYNNSLTSVTIPNSVTSIGSSAFSSCSSLTSVTIPNSVTSIGDYAFSDCSGLTSVTIPNSVTSIGRSAFYYCSSLTSVTIGNSVTFIGNSAFEDCSSLTSVTIGNSVTSIGNYAFGSCSSLTSVTIPNSVTSIGEGAFAYCSSLTSVTIGNSVTSIGNSAFANCSNLTSVTIGSGLTSIGNYAFYGCIGLTSIVSNAVIPPAIGGIETFPYPNICSVTVPCGSLGAYTTPVCYWSVFFPNRITEEGDVFDVSVAANDDSFGSVSVESQSCSVKVITATPSSCKSFTAWNDGNTDNPRTITVTSDTSFTAIFESVELSSNITAAICEGSTYAENGFNVSQAGVYTQHFQTANGCDSTVTLTLTVNPTYSLTIDATINQGDVYQENGFDVSEAGVYTQNLQTVNGCDSVIVLNLTVNSSLGDVSVNTIEVALYPNPAEDYTVLKVQGLKEQTKVALFDLRGRKLREFDLAVGPESIRLDLRDLPSGVYTLMIGNTTKKLIVE